MLAVFLAVRGMEQVGQPGLLAAVAEGIAALPALALPAAGVLILAAVLLLSFAVSCSIFEKQEP